MCTMKTTRSTLVCVLLGAALLLLFLQGGIQSTTAQTTDPVLVGAGDIASCLITGDEATAALLDNIAGTVFTAGDNAYDSGSASEYANCYDPNWGRHKARTRPAVGNHEYFTFGASGYFNYFGAAAGDPSKGYYSYDLGTWHIIVLNSEIDANLGSPQEQWLRGDLAAHPTTCTLAMWHQPLFSSGPNGSNPSYYDFWRALYEYGADVVIGGHDHNYERFAPQTMDGVADSSFGMREFVVGTGGKSHNPVGTPVANSEVTNTDTFGVLKLTLHASSYDWQFVPEAGKTFNDSGSGACHGVPPSLPPRSWPTTTNPPTIASDSFSRSLLNTW